MKKIFEQKVWIFLLIFWIGIAFSLEAEAAIYPAKYQIPSETEQLVTVRYQKNSKAKLCFYQRNEKGSFRKVFSCSAWLGKRGIGKKKEGDRKTPTGLYRLEQAFGILKNPGTKMPYLKVNSKHYWCSDSGTSYYNTLIRSNQIPHKCTGEHLIDYKGYYDYAISIGYNKKQIAREGSAIFLHCYKKSYTGGCVAIKKTQMRRLLKSLKPEKKPMILIDRW